MIALLLGVGILVMPASPASPVSPAPVAQCFEDQPCWDCESMGNRVCGPSALLWIEAPEYAIEAQR